MFARLLFLQLALLFSLSVQAADAIRVVVSIAPIHSLVAGVMAGVAEPELLVTGAGSPHGYMLKPSQVRSLRRADMVVWVGEGVEGFLRRPLADIGDSGTVIKLIDEPGMHLLAAREGGVWQAGHNNHDHDNGHGEVDSHLWLAPENAGNIVKIIAAHLSRLDSQHADHYLANSERLQQKLFVLDEQLKQRLAAVNQIPYLVFHDAYHYLEHAYGLNPVGSIMVDVDHKPGARRLMQIRQRVKETNARCVFSEPQFPEKVISVVMENTSLKSARLDPVGMSLPPGEELYFNLMRNIGDSLVSCLGQDY